MRNRWPGGNEGRALACSVLAAVALTGCAAYGPQSGGTAVQASYEQGPGYDHGYVSVSYFYDELAPYGRWVEIAPYGWCWTPYDISIAWRPYHDGTWVYTELGWTWVSYEPWGWATCHYGRWFYDTRFGWMWVPGTIWGPAWVAWHASDRWIGWAPLPPTAAWGPSFGLRFEGSVTIAPSAWCFVDRRDLGDADLGARIVSYGRNHTLLRETRDITRFESRGGRPVNRGFEVGAFERLTGQPVRRVDLVDAQEPPRGRERIEQPGRVPVFRPEVRGSARRAPPPRDRGEGMGSSSESAPVARQREDSERRRFEASLTEARARLERAHHSELQELRRGQSAAQVRKRQAEERQDFERHAHQQRQVLEERLRRRIFDPRQAQEERRGRGRDKDKDNDRGRGRSG